MERGGGTVSGKHADSVYYRVLDDALSLSEKIEQMGRKRFDELTGRQIMFLAMISSFDEKPSLGDMARKARCSHQNAKTVLGALHKKGFLDFKLDADDQRVLRIHLTKKGRAVGLRALEELDRLVSRIGENVDREAAEAFADVIAELSEAFGGTFSLMGDRQDEQAAL